MVEGPQALAEALADPRRPVRQIFVTAAARRSHAQLLASAAVPVCAVSEATLAGLAETVTPQGLVGVVEFIDVPLRQVLASGCSLVAVLAQVRDPGNAGTVLRCADAAGVDGVVISSESVDAYNV
ncbi:MAG: TrmH family RNA methyltransferase, partial [Mycobacteriales bacterium]